MLSDIATILFQLFLIGTVVYLLAEAVRELVADDGTVVGSRRLSAVTTAEPPGRTSAVGGQNRRPGRPARSGQRTPRLSGVLSAKLRLAR